MKTKLVYQMVFPFVLLCLVTGAAAQDELFFNRINITEQFGDAHAVEAVDLDLDGDMDIIAAAFFDDGIAWWENSGDMAVSYTHLTLPTNREV